MAVSSLRDRLEDFDTLMRKVQKDKYSCPLERPWCYLALDEYESELDTYEADLEECEEKNNHLRAKLQKVENEKQRNERKFQFEIQQNERKYQRAQQEKRRQIQNLEDEYAEIFQSKQQHIRHLEKAVIDLNVKIKLLNETIFYVQSGYRNVISKCMRAKEHELFELKEQLITFQINLKETVTELDETRNKQVYELNQHEQRDHYLHKMVEDRDEKIKSLKKLIDNMKLENSERNEQRKPSVGRSVQKDLKEGKETLVKLKVTCQKINDIRAKPDLTQFTEKQDLKTGKDFKRKQDLESSHAQMINSLELKIKQLNGEIENREQKLTDLEKKLRYRTTEELEEMELIKGLKEKEDQLSEQRNQFQRSMTKLEETKTKLNEMTCDRDLERRARQALEREAAKNITKIKEQAQLNDKITSLKQRIQHLEREVERRDLKLKGLEERLNNRKHEAERERHLIKDLREKNDPLSELSIQLQQALTKLEETEAKLKESMSERDIEHHKRQGIERRAEKDHKRIKELEQVNERMVTQQKHRIQTLERELEGRDVKITGLEKMIDQTNEDVRSGNELNDVLRKREQQLVKQEDQLKQAFIKLKETETELEETKTRLSKAMGDRLTDNNPNIADLSDKNRPVKLAEKYAELYDNQWTDAFDILGKYFDNEQSTIEALLQILLEVMHFCVENGSKQMEELQSILGFSNNPAEDVPIDVRKHFKDCRKAMSTIALRNVYEVYISHLKRTAPQTLGKVLEVRPFVQECLDICWLMVIQDPPVAFAPVEKQGSKLNTDIYKPYTSSGAHIEYTVWPALLLHEGGPVLAKGVAQGYGKK